MGKPVHLIEWTYLDMGKPFDDGGNILYVNTLMAVQQYTVPIRFVTVTALAA